MKTCTSCNVEKDLICFNFRNKEKGIRITKCKTCVSERDKTRYTNDPIRRENIYNNRKERRLKLKLWVQNYLKSNPCVDCGESDIRCLDFDHVSDNKVLEISTMRAEGYSIENIQKEIAKCEIRCANCHRKITHDRRMAL